MSARLSQFWSLLPTKAKVPPRARGWRRSDQVTGNPGHRGRPRRGEAAGRGAVGDGQGPGPRPMRAPGAVRRVRRWARSPGCRSPVRLGRRAREEESEDPLSLPLPPSARL